MIKTYVVDTSVLLEDENCLEILWNGGENEVVVPNGILSQLRNLRGNPKKGELALRAINALNGNFDKITFVEGMDALAMPNYTTAKDGIVIVSNDPVFRLRCRIAGLKAQEYISSKPIQTESELYTGFADDSVPNSFEWIDGKPYYHSVKNPRVVSYEHEIWKVKPRNVYQNLAFELLLDDSLDLVTLQSKAGFGKSYLAIAAAMYLVLEKKLFSKIVVVKSPVELGPALGFLPGEISDKLDPYYRPIYDLVHKLHSLRPAAKLYMDKPDENVSTKFNKRYFEVLPLSFIRGMNIENSVVIVDEMQNLSRTESRALLTRMGENTRCFCLGDTNQVDNPYLNEFNNGLNWTVSLAKGQPNYGHLVLKGTKSRGAVTDLILKVGL